MKKLLTLTLATGLAFGLTACTTPTQTANCTNLTQQLTGKTWQIEDINNQGIIDSSHITMTFDQGKVYGTAGCNRYSASYQLENCKIKFTQGLSTKMACPEAIMNQENKFLSSLNKLNSIKFTTKGALIIHGEEQRSIRAFPIKSTR